jgi:hypothetical protein
LEFLMPINGPVVKRSSCLAQCEGGGVVKKPDGEIEGGVRGPKECTDLLQRLGFNVSKDLLEAYEMRKVGDRRAVAEQDLLALNAYKRAWALAVGGLGFKPGSKPSLVTRFLKDPQAPNWVLTKESEFTASHAAKFITPAQIRWLARVLIGRSRQYILLARRTAFPVIPRLFALRRATEDAQYALRLAEISYARAPASVLAKTVLTEALEQLAKSYERTQNIAGAISVYERLLTLEPPSAPGLSRSIAAKRGIQELVLASHRRGIADTNVVSRSMTARAISDSEYLRTVAKNDLTRLEDWVLRAAPSLHKARRAAATPILRDQHSGRLAEQGQAEATMAIAGLELIDSIKVPARVFRYILFQAARRALDDIERSRDAVARDVGRLQLSALQGDPLFNFIKGRWGSMSGQLKTVPIAIEDNSLLITWLRDQTDKGALPRDPEMLKTLLVEASNDAQLRSRLIAQATEATYR